MAQQVLWLQGELQRLEQDIKDRENELKAATTEEGRAIVREWIDRLVQEKREVRERPVRSAFKSCQMHYGRPQVSDYDLEGHAFPCVFVAASDSLSHRQFALKVVGSMKVRT